MVTRCKRASDGARGERSYDKWEDGGLCSIVSAGEDPGVRVIAVLTAATVYSNNILQVVTPPLLLSLF